MENNTVYQSQKDNCIKDRILQLLHQPLTAIQVSRISGIPAYTCSYLMAKLAQDGFIFCINSKARNCRLYWLTEHGKRYRKDICTKLKLSYEEYDLSKIDWNLYGWVCFRHRSAIIKYLSEPMQPSEIKRLLRIRQANINISANNIRDIIRLFLSKDIVRPVKVKKKSHLRYELTDTGIKFRQLLIQAEKRI